MSSTTMVMSSTKTTQTDLLKQFATVNFVAFNFHTLFNGLFGVIQKFLSNDVTKKKIFNSFWMSFMGISVINAYNVYHINSNVISSGVVEVFYLLAGMIVNPFLVNAFMYLCI